MNPCHYCGTQDMIRRMETSAVDEGVLAGVRAAAALGTSCTCRTAPPTELLDMAKKVLSHSKTVDAELLREWAVQLASYVHSLENK